MKGYKDKMNAFSSDVDAMSEEIGKIKAGDVQGMSAMVTTVVLVALLIAATLVGLTIWLV